jgi:hypothetical protein
MPRRLPRGDGVSFYIAAAMADFNRLLGSLWLMNAIANAPATTIKPTTEKTARRGPRHSPLFAPAILPQQVISN